MSLASVTYNEIVNAVKSYITTNCSNIANYSGMDSCFKSGYSTTTTIAGNAAAYTYYTVSITSYISQVTSSTVDSEMSSFLSSIGVTDLTATCTANNFFNFVNDMISFCATKLAFTVSQYSSNRYLVYYTGNTSFSNTYTMDEAATTRIAKASDVVQLMTAIVDIAKQTMRCVPCQYSITFS